MTSKKELYNEFVAYHTASPEIWKAFEEKALLIAKKKLRFGARAIFEILRWETSVSGEGSFKLRNAMSAYYARLFAQKHPEHSSLFRFAKGLYWEDL